MGHSSPDDTAYYLRLTAESYPISPPKFRRVVGDVVRLSQEGRSMATDFAVFLRRFLTAHLAGLRGCSPNTGRVLSRHVQVADRLLPPTTDPSRRKARPRLHRRHRDHRVLGLARGQQAQQRVDPEPAPGRDQLVLPVDAIARPCPDGLLPRHSRHPCQEAGPTGREPSQRRADPPSARPARPVHPAGRRDATLLATLYDTAARVQELADLTVRDIRLETRPWQP